MKSPEEMEALFPYAVQALENTQKIADRCHVISSSRTKLPKYDVPDGYTSLGILQKLCYEGLEKHYADPSEALKERLQYEVDYHVKNMGFVDYFLDRGFIKYAKDHGIAVGPGQGDAQEALCLTVWRSRRSIRIKYSSCLNVF